MRKLIYLLMVAFHLTAFAQLDELQKISLDNVAHTNFEKSYVFQNNDVYYYFFREPGQHSLLVYESVDNGESWQMLYELSEITIPSQSEKSIDILQIEETKFLIAQINNTLRELKLFLFDVASGSTEQIGTTHSFEIAVSQIELTVIDELIYFTSLKNSDDEVFYITTNDGGFSWSEIQNFSNINTNERPLSITYHNDLLYTVVTDNQSIDMLVSTDQGGDWNKLPAVYTNDNPISNPEIISDGSELYIVFEEHLPVEVTNDEQTDVSYISSNDNGQTWSNKVKYAKYIRNDFISSINLSDDQIFALTLSNRINQGRLDTYLGYLKTTEDPAPPAIYWTDIPDKINFDQDFQIRVFANDETGITSISTEFNDELYTLYDDGNHNDSLAGDNIYGITIEGVPSNASLDPNDAKVVGVNNIYLPINNIGVIADVAAREFKYLNITVKDTDENKSVENFDLLLDELYGSISKYDGKDIIFSSGFFISGYSENTLWFNAVSSSSLMVDYQAGSVGSDPADPDNLIYSVHSGDTPFGNSWQDWKKAVDNGAYFYDGDNDGEYNPVDKNENGVWDTNEDKPDLLYDGVYYTVYNDGVPSDERRFDTMEPKGIEVRQSIYASNRNSILDDVIFIRYSLLYKGLGNANEPDSLTDVYFSIWSDSDIGDAGDDKVGCDTTLHSGYTYNDGSDDVFGENPPAVFKTIVQGPLVKSGKSTDYGYKKFGPDRGFHALQGYKNLGMTTFAPPHKNHYKLLDPRNPLEGRRYQEALYPSDGSEIDPCTFEFGEVRGGVNCADVNNKFWFSGDPVTDYGWIGTKVLDMRDLTTTGTFTLHKNEPMDIIVAYVVGQGSDNLNSITRAREITQYAHEEYKRNFSTIVGVNEKNEELPSQFYLSQNYPNPFNPTTSIEYQVSSSEKVSLKVYDILGREVKTLVNEIKAPGTYKITFDASQLASGVYLYRLTSGSFTQTKKMMVLK